jgi:prevent-host-death family protein
VQVRQISVSQAKRRWSWLLAEVARGRVFHITRRGKPMAELIPILEPEKTKRELGFAKGIITYMAPDFDAPLEDFREYME